MIRIIGILYLDLDVVRWPVIVHMMYEGTSVSSGSLYQLREAIMGHDVTI